MRLAGQPGYLLVTWVQLTQLEVQPDVQLEVQPDVQPEVQLVVQPVQLVQPEVQLFVQPVQVWHDPPQRAHVALLQGLSQLWASAPLLKKTDRISYPPVIRAAETPHLLMKSLLVALPVSCFFPSLIINPLSVLFSCRYNEVCRLSLFPAIFQRPTSRPAAP